MIKAIYTGTEFLESAAAGDEVGIILETTSFYTEQGGFVLPTSCLDWLIYRTVLKKLKPMERPAEHCLEIARALTYLHSIADPPIIHRNVKSMNIILVLDNNLTTKVSDFGTLVLIRLDQTVINTEATG